MLPCRVQVAAGRAYIDALRNLHQLGNPRKFSQYNGEVEY